MPTAQQVRAINLIDCVAEDYPDVAEPPESAQNWSDERIRAYFQSGGVDQGAGDDEEVGELEPAPAVPTLLAPGIPPFKAVEEYARISEVLEKRGVTAHPDVEQASLFLDGVGPKGRMEVRVYRPTTPGVRPALFYITGGAYFTCNLDERDFVCANLARSGFCVFSVKYRTLEDEAVYPAAMVDAYAALLWLAAGSHAGELRYNPAALMLCGESAGAHITTTMLMRAVTRSERALAAVKGQVLICSSIHYGYAPDKWQDYFPGVAGDPGFHEKTLYCSCLSQLHTAEMMARQPPALLVTADDDEWDARFKTQWCSLRLLSVVYARRLTAAGVAATHRHYVGPGKQRRPHCFMCNDYVGRSLWALEALVDIAEWAHAVLNNTTPPTTVHDYTDTEEPCPVLDEWYS